jgi:ATP-dependent Clp protease adaptor protein ClpS
MINSALNSPLKKEQTFEETEVLEKTTTRGPWSIVIFNDDWNTFEHVINCLIKYCNHTVIQAEQLSLIIHNTGKARVKEGEHSTLLPIHEALVEQGLGSTIQEFC